MRFPTTDRYVSSPFGWRTHPVTGIRTLHAGADFPLPGLGAPLIAVRNFSLYAKGYSDTGGNWVALRLDDGVLAYYYHMQSPTHLTGGGSEGSIVGRMGSSGRFTTGPHVHFETRRADGTPFDPIPYLTQGAAAGGGGSPFPPAAGEPETEKGDTIMRTIYNLDGVDGQDDVVSKRRRCLVGELTWQPLSLGAAQREFKLWGTPENVSQTEWTDIKTLVNSRRKAAGLPAIP